jgi:hypothetical protein
MHALCQATPWAVRPASHLSSTTEVGADVVQARRHLTQRRDPYHGVDPCHAELLSDF